ncbi:unnamed protein product [Dicrocoelium dendriticum]|nr:unnamed protein product [Dicrocoelium dendriticum]
MHIYVCTYYLPPTCFQTTADSIASEILSASSLQQLRTQELCAHSCTAFCKSLFSVAKAQARLSDDGELEQNLSALESHLRHSNSCVLSHSLRGTPIPFDGTVESFGRLQSDNWKGDEHQLLISFSSDVNLFRLLEYLCGICLDTHLYSHALNLAVQVCLLGSSCDPPPDPVLSQSSKWMDSLEFTEMISDFVSFNQPPAGLSNPLWLRVSELCQSFSPIVPPCDDPPEHTDQQDEADQSVLCTSNDDHADTSIVDQVESSHFVQVHDLSVKEQQLRFYAHPMDISEDGVSPGDEFDTTSDSNVTPYQGVTEDYLSNGFYSLLENRNDIPSEHCPDADEPDDSVTDTDVDLLVLRRYPTCEQSLVDTVDVLDDADYSEQLHQSSESWGAIRCVSILKLPDRSVDLSSPERRPTICKHVRFSLDSCHPSPALEAEYGGRSNRKRLLDFARRRQMLNNSGDIRATLLADQSFAMFLRANCNPIPMLLRCLRHILCLLSLCFHTRVKLILWLCILVSTLFSCTLFTCCHILHLPLVQWPLLVKQTASINPVSDSWDVRVCSTLLHWFAAYLRN